MPSPSNLRDVYLACAPSAYRRARSILGHEEDAWDVVQKIFLKLAEEDWLSRISVRPMTYIYRAMTNACLNELASRRVRQAEQPAPDDTLDGEVKPPSEALHARDLLFKLDAKLDELDRRILVLAFHDGLAQEAIAEVLGVWRRTVGRRLTRLRELVGELERAPETAPASMRRSS